MEGLIGALSGMTEVLIQQPFVTIKNTWQQGEKVLWHPKILYRGLLVNALSIAPISATQFQIQSEMKNHFIKKSERKLTLKQDMICAASGGFASAFWSSPAELIMITQQQRGHSATQTVQYILQRNHLETNLFQKWIRNCKGMYVGFLSTAVREMVFTVGYLALAPYSAALVMPASPRLFGTKDEQNAVQETSAAMAGSILAGLVTVAVTQPIDTLKTVVQGNVLKGNRYGKYAAAIASIHQRGGKIAFWNGSLPRGLRLIGAIFILGQAKTFYEKILRNNEEDII